MQYKRKRAGLLKSALLGAATLGVISLAGIGVAQAGTISVSYVTTNPSSPDRVNLSGTIDGSTFQANSQIAAQIRLTVSGGGYKTGTTLGVWCVDLFHDIYAGHQSTQYTMGLLNTDNSNNPSPLSTQQKSTIGNLAAYGNQLLATAGKDTAANSAKIQSAIWYAEYNNTSNGNKLFISGYGSNDSVLTSLITMVDNAGYGSAGQLISLDNTQGLAYVTGVPEPGSLALLGTGLLGLGLVARRRRRKAA